MQAPKLTILDAEKAARATTCAETCEGEKKEKREMEKESVTVPWLRAWSGVGEDEGLRRQRSRETERGKP